MSLGTSLRTSLRTSLGTGLRTTLGAVRRELLSTVQRRAVRLAAESPIVSFSFDDFPRSAFLVGGPVLEDSGARGTYYAAPGLMHTSNELGEQFRADDLHALTERGHELASHTFSHVSCRAISAFAFRAEVKKGKSALAEMAVIEAANFAYPFGHVTVRAKKIVGPEVASARGIFPGFNGPELDLNLLRANSLYGDLERSAWVRELIEENVRRCSWLIFYTHDVQANPSPFGCTASLLQSAVSAARRSGSRIMTINQVLADEDHQSTLTHDWPSVACNEKVPIGRDYGSR